MRLLKRDVKFNILTFFIKIIFTPDLIDISLVGFILI
jgi:hypothetical protein